MGLLRWIKQYQREIFIIVLLISSLLPLDSTVAGQTLLADSANFSLWLPLFPARSRSYLFGTQVANLESREVTVTITAYNPDGTVNGAPLTDRIPANGSKTYFPIFTVPSGFTGAIRLTSDFKLAAITNILTADITASGSFVNPALGATKVRLPLLSKNNAGYTSFLGVQNTGTAPATVTIAYSDGIRVDVTIPVNSAQIFYQADEAHTQTVFAALITSNEPVVASAVLTNGKILFAYIGFTDGSTNPVFPIINANNSGFVTGIQLQNIGDQETNVTLTYTPSAVGDACTETKPVGAGQTVTFALAAFANGLNSTCSAGARFVGAARVTGNSAAQPLVAITNQLSATQGGAYAAFDPATATSKVVLPLVMDRNGGFYTGFNVMNVGTSTTQVACTFSASSFVLSRTLDPGQAFTEIQFNKFADRYVGSATCTTSSGGKIVAVVNELGPSATADQLLVYEGFATQ